jgi:tetraprenyl-beta-curcumene synthase
LPELSNAMPLSGPQRLALLRAAGWQLTGGLQAVARELRGWRARAAAIPDPRLREEALDAIDNKRGHTDGAALFWTLTPSRNLRLLQLLVAFEVIYDYLDNVSERGARAGVVEGQHIFHALADALNPGRAPRDYYRGHPWRDDGGYLRMLVLSCQAGCRALPRFEAVRACVELETSRQRVLALNHDCDPARREAVLRHWAAQQFSDDYGLEWFELTAASSQSVVTFTLLALAADSRVTVADAEQLHAAYFPWFAYAVTMLDAYVDQDEDAQTGAHSYIAYYGTSETAVRRLCESVERSAEDLLALCHGERHAVLLGCMIAMYLSKNSALAPHRRGGTTSIRCAGGTLATVLVPVLRMWRICNRQTTAT